MKIKNKKTGEIVDIIGECRNGFTLRLRSGHTIFINSLTELNAEWEDAPEEPKPHYSITQFGDVVDEVDGYMNETIDELKEIGNYFDTREEAKKAVEKLKAVKRLKDKGFRFIELRAPNYCSSKIITIKAECDWSSKNIDDLILLFGGEE